MHKMSCLILDPVWKMSVFKKKDSPLCIVLLSVGQYVSFWHATDRAYLP